MQIVKRDGTKQPFNREKIVNAILASFKAVDDSISTYAVNKANNIADYIEGYAKESNDELSVEEIQDLVEKGLCSTKRKDVAKAYILYREERTRARTRNTELMKIVSEKLTASNVQNQNANIDEHSFGGRRGEADSALMKQYALDYCMSKMARENHLNNEIYIHDLDSYAVGMHNCLSIPFDKLLSNGFNTRQTDVRPANSINTAFQLVAVIFQLQSLQQFGGCSATHLDWTMVPYVRKSFAKHFKDGIKYCCPDSTYNLDSLPTSLSFDDKEANEPYNKPAYDYALDMTVKETYQAVEGMYHNLK
jgi:ribonucleoside-triphosphate reductase